MNPYGWALGVALLMASSPQIQAQHANATPETQQQVLADRVEAIASRFDLEGLRRDVERDAARTGGLDSGDQPAASPEDRIGIHEVRLQQMVRAYLQESMFRPDSAEFRHQYGVCGEVNSISRTSGYTGYQRFIAGSKDLVILETGPELPREGFDLLWDKLCRQSPTGAPRKQGAAYP